MAFFDANDPKVRKELRDLLGPEAVGKSVRNAVFLCWTLMPEERRSPAAVESEIRREVDLALKELQARAAASTPTKRASEIRSLAQQYVHSVYGVAPTVFALGQYTKAALLAEMAKHGDELKEGQEASRMVQILHGAPEDSNWWMVIFHAFRAVVPSHHQTSVQLVIDDQSSAIHEFKQVYDLPTEPPASEGDSAAEEKGTP